MKTKRRWSRLGLCVGDDVLQSCHFQYRTWVSLIEITEFLPIKSSNGTYIICETESSSCALLSNSQCICFCGNYNLSSFIQVCEMGSPLLFPRHWNEQKLMYSELPCKPTSSLWFLSRVGYVLEREWGRTGVFSREASSAGEGSRGEIVIVITG